MEAARQNGISQYRFYKSVHENGFERIGKGVYFREDALIDELNKDKVVQLCYESIYRPKRKIRILIFSWNMRRNSR